MLGLYLEREINYEPQEGGWPRSLGQVCLATGRVIINRANAEVDTDERQCLLTFLEGIRLLPDRGRIYFVPPAADDDSVGKGVVAGLVRHIDRSYLAIVGDALAGEEQNLFVCPASVFWDRTLEGDFETVLEYLSRIDRFFGELFLVDPSHFLEILGAYKLDEFNRKVVLSCAGKKRFTTEARFLQYPERLGKRAISAEKLHGVANQMGQDLNLSQNFEDLFDGLEERGFLQTVNKNQLRLPGF